MASLPPTVAGKAPLPPGGKAPLAAGKAPISAGKAPMSAGKAPIGGKAPALAAKAAKKAAKASKGITGGKGKDGSKGKGKGKDRTGEKKAPVSQSVRSGLIFPVGRTHRLLKQQLLQGQRVGGTAAIYLACAVEYLVSEVLEMAAKCAQEMKVKRITQRHILFAVRADEELDALMKGDISGAGVMPHINKALLEKKKKKRAKRRRGATGLPE